MLFVLNIFYGHRWLLLHWKYYWVWNRTWSSVPSNLLFPLSVYTTHSFQPPSVLFYQNRNLGVFVLNLISMVQWKILLDCSVSDILHAHRKKQFLLYTICLVELLRGCMSLYLLWMLCSKVLVHSFSWVRLAKDKFKWWKLHLISNSFVQMYFLFWSCDCSFVIMSSECNAPGVMNSSPLCDILQHTTVVFILLHKFSQMWTNLLTFYLNWHWQTFCNLKIIDSEF